MKKHSEIYYAVKIGERPKNNPYFMINEMDTEVPQIFTTQKRAEQEARKRTEGGKVVKVEIREV